MKLYLICHSNAIDLGTSDYEDDSQRPLTEKGREKAVRIAAALKGLSVDPDLIVSSPYVRAAQTAEILAKGLKLKREPAFSDCLVPMGDADLIVAEINEKYTVDELLLVGHEPCLAD